MHRLARRLAAVLLALFVVAGLAAPAVAVGEPVVQSQTPAPDSTVLPTGVVSATFDKALHKGSTPAPSSITVTNQFGLKLAGATSFSNSDTTITWTYASGDLPEAGSPYGVTVVAKDALVPTLEATVQWTFSVDSTPPATPVIESVAGDASTPAQANDSTPEVTVTGVSGAASVKLFVDGVEKASKAVASGATSVVFNQGSDSDFTVAACTTPPLSDPCEYEEYSLTAKSVDTLGNASGASAVFDYRYDVKPPATPTIQSVDGNTSSPATGNDPTPTIVVSGVTADHSVQIEVDGTPVGEPKTVPTAATSVTFNAGDDSDVVVSPDGARSLTAVHTEPAGNSAESAAFSYTLDTAAPAAPVINSVHGDSTSPAVGNDLTPTIVVGGVVAGQAVAIFEGSGTTALATKTVPDGATSVTFNSGGSTEATVSSGDGDKALTASVTDVAGNESARSAVFVYTYDSTAPGQPAIASVHGRTTSPASGNVLTFDVVVTGVVAGDTVEILDGASAVGDAEVADGATEVTVNVTIDDACDPIPAPDCEDHSLTAVATDPAGNDSPASAAFVYVHDTTAPSAPSIDSVEDDSTTPATGSDPTPKVVVSGVTAGDTVRIYEGATLRGSKEATGATVTFNAAESDADVTVSSADGQKSLTATAVDPADNESAASTAFVYDLQGSTPTLVSRSPAAGAVVQPPATVSATFAGAINTGTSTIVVKDQVGSVIAGATSFTDSDTRIVFTPSGALTEAGSPYTVEVSAENANGVTPVIWSFTVDTTAPSAPAIAAVNGDTSSPAYGNTFTVPVVVSGVVAGDTVKVLDDGAEVGSAVVPAGATQVTIGVTVADDCDPVPSLGCEDHPLTATATDPAGNTSTASATFTYTVDQEAPGAPTINSVDGDTASPATGNDTTPTIVVGDVVEGDTVRLFDGGTLVGSKVVPASATSVTFNAGADSDAALAGDGDHVLTATATDLAGNTSPASAAFTYTLDTQAPAAPAITSVAGDTATPAYGNTRSPVVVVSGAAAGDTITIYEGATVLASKVVPGGQTSVTFNDGTTDFQVTDGDGDKVLTAVSSDAAGNDSGGSSPFTYVLDTAVPAAPAIASVEGDSSSPASGNDLTPTVIVNGVTAGDLVRLLQDGSEIGQLVVGGEATSVTFNALEADTDATITGGDGTKALTATTADRAGNESPASASFTYTVDSTAPAVPTIDSVVGDNTSPAAGQDSTPPIVVSGVVAGDTVRIYDGTSLIGSKVVPVDATSVTLNAAAGDADATVTSTGDRELRATAADPAGNESAMSLTFIYSYSVAGGGGGGGGGTPPPAEPDPVTRLAGPDRLRTAIEASKHGYDTALAARAVVLATADGFADALAGTPLAHEKGGPLLLNSGTSLDPNVKAEIQRVLSTGRTVYVLGGTAAVPASVASELEGLGYTVVRLAGDTRFDTAVAIAEALGDPSTILLATGHNFADALAGGAAASFVSGAILLTDGNTMPAATKAYLDSHPGTTRYALGGPAAAAAPGATPLIGTDRYDTSRKIAEAFFPASTTAVGVASGEVAFDGLAGGAHAALQSAPLVLVSVDSLPASVKTWMETNRATLDAGFVYGGPVRISDSTVQAVQTAITD